MPRPRRDREKALRKKMRKESSLESGRGLNPESLCRSLPKQKQKKRGLGELKAETKESSLPCEHPKERLWAFYPAPPMRVSPLTHIWDPIYRWFFHIS